MPRPHTAAAAALLAAAARRCAGGDVFPARTRYLVFSDVEKEHYGAGEVALTVNGTLPEWLHGTLWKNGMGKYSGWDTRGGKRVPFHFNFALDAMAHLTKFSIDGSAGTVRLQNRLMTNSVFNQSSEHIPHTLTFGGSTPDVTLEEGLQTIADGMVNGHLAGDNLAVNIQAFEPGQLFMLSDWSGEGMIDPSDLSYLGMHQWPDKAFPDKPIDGPLNIMSIATCAHPVRHGRWIWNYKVSNMPNRSSNVSGAAYEIYRIDTTRTPYTREVVARVPIGGSPRWMHSFVVTDHFIILVEFPLEIEIMGALEGFPRMHMLDAFKWRPENGTRVQILRYDDAGVERYNELHTDALFGYHHINAYEDGEGNVVSDIACWDNADHLLGGVFNLTTLRNDTTPPKYVPPSQIRRLTIPVATNTGAEKITYRKTPSSIDLPWVDWDNYRGKPYRWAYGLGGAEDGDFWDTILKVDVTTGLIDKTWMRVPHWPSEPTFVKRPGGEAEDDGVLLAQMIDGDRSVGYLLVLNATTMETIATAYAPINLPFASHGTWVAGA